MSEPVNLYRAVIGQDDIQFVNETLDMILKEKGLAILQSVNAVIHNSAEMSSVIENTDTIQVFIQEEIKPHYKNIMDERVKIEGIVNIEKVMSVMTKFTEAPLVPITPELQTEDTNEDVREEPVASVDQN